MKGTYVLRDDIRYYRYLQGLEQTTRIAEYDMILERERAGAYVALLLKTHELVPNWSHLASRERRLRGLASKRVFRTRATKDPMKIGSAK